MISLQYDFGVINYYGKLKILRRVKDERKSSFNLSGMSLKELPNYYL